MPSRLNPKIYEGNDEKMSIIISDEDDGTPQNLTGATVEVYIKDASDTPDDDVSVVKLSNQTSGVSITDAAAGVALISFPNTISAGTLWWRVDVILSGSRKTACYGALTVVNT